MYLARRKTKDYEISLVNKDLGVLRRRFTVAVQEAERNAFAEKHLAVTSVDDWFYTWFEIFKKPSLRAWKTYMSRYRNFYGKYIGNEEIKTLTAFHLQMVTNELLGEDKSPQRVADALGSLRECLDGAVSNGILSSNPAVPVCLPKDYKAGLTYNNRKKRIKFLTLEEQKYVISYLQKVNHWYSEMIQIMLLHGLRMGEVGGLCWKDIDFDKKVIHIRRALHCDYFEGYKELYLGLCKSENSYRELPFSSATGTIFLQQQEKIIKLRKEKTGMRWKEQREEFQDLVFWTTFGTPVVRTVAEQNFSNIKAEVNAVRISEGLPPLENFYPHMTRHSFATRCFELGMRDVTVQELMGHSNINTTRIYMHIVFDSVRKEYEKMDCLLGDFGVH